VVGAIRAQLGQHAPRTGAGLTLSGRGCSLSDEGDRLRRIEADYRCRGSSASVYVYVPDAECVFQRAVAARARVIVPVTDKEWGNRVGSFEDPFSAMRV